tara:strand:- start:562 stop:1245 length:684 start_codon:yes stop_codon:yes gene_type:complete
MLSTLTKTLITFYIVIILSSCANLPPNVAGNFNQTYKAFSNLIFGFEDYPITQEVVDQIPYASMRMKIGKGPAGLLILESIDREANKFTWVSADSIFITTQNGRIIRAEGLLNNLTDFISSEPSFEQILDDQYLGQKFKRYISLDNPEVYEMELNVSFEKFETEDVFILGRKRELVLIEETIENSYTRWKHTNKYWVDQNSGFVWQSIQEIAPNLPPIFMQITKKPS